MEKKIQHLYTLITFNSPRHIMDELVIETIKNILVITVVTYTIAWFLWEPKKNNSAEDFNNDIIHNNSNFFRKDIKNNNNLEVYINPEDRKFINDKTEETFGIDINDEENHRNLIEILLDLLKKITNLCNKDFEEVVSYGIYGRIVAVFERLRESWEHRREGAESILTEKYREVVKLYDLFIKMYNRMAANAPITTETTTSFLSSGNILIMLSIVCLVGSVYYLGESIRESIAKNTRDLLEKAEEGLKRIENIGETALVNLGKYAYGKIFDVKFWWIRSLSQTNTERAWLFWMYMTMWAHKYYNLMFNPMWRYFNRE